jgi:hypothetical protein
VTHPDLSFVVNKVCQYLHEPRISHWSVVKHVLRYVCHTLDSGFAALFLLLYIALCGLFCKLSWQYG